MKKCLLILFILLNGNALAAISKWVDSNGQIHYSDQPPPPNTQPQILSTPAVTEGNASAVSSSKTLAEQEAELKKAERAKKEAADKEAQRQAALAAQQQNCNNAQQEMKALQSGIRIVSIDENGAPSYIDDNERQKRIEKAQNDVSTYCK